MKNKQEIAKAKLWSKLIYTGRKREKLIKGEPINLLSREDMDTIITTLRFFEISETDWKLAILDLNWFRYRVYDWLGMGLTGRIEVNKANGDNVVFALAEIYCNVNSVQKFIGFLRDIDLELWQGKFDTDTFVDFIKKYK